MIARLRWGIEWSDLDYLNDPSMFSMPILVFHGTRDETVPIATSDERRATSDELKRYVPETQLVRCLGAGHIECWNLDPQAYESKLITFLDNATS